MNVTLKGGRLVITCLDVGAAKFAEPFFDQTIELERHARPVVTPYSDLRAGSGSSSRPAGFIFHMSRCGSTLVSQLLKEIAGVRVYSEPSPISHGLSLAPRLPRRRIRELLETVIRAFCSRSGPVLFKLSSWNILDYSLFDELFPGVPKLFVVRRPVEVLESIAKMPPGFVIHRSEFAELVRSRAGDRTGTLDDLEFAAVMLSLFLDTMAAAADGPTRVLDYSELPSAAWRTLPPFFGVDKAAIDVARMRRAARFHSKSYPNRVRFKKEDERATRARRARVERCIATWIGSRYDDLIAHRRLENAPALRR